MSKILITSALPYVNNIPHLGNIVGCVLPADVYARYCKRTNNEVLFICGADEYGSCTLVKAVEENLTPREICDKYIEIHKEIYKWFNIEFDYFGRTSTPDPQNDTTWNHTIISQDIFRKFAENNYLIEENLEQLFCPELNITVADRFVIGICPKCKYNKAKGDQCDICGECYNAIDLINPQYKFNENYKLERKTFQHLFLDLPKLEHKLKLWYDSVKNNWAENAVHITDAWFKEGLKKRCITRDIKWGTPVPDTIKYGDKYKDKVMYNWIDACYGYLSITAEYTKNWKDWWINTEKNKEIKLVQMFSSDNVPFHTVLLPATLLATHENYTLVHKVASCEYLTYEGRKFSKSENIGVFGDSAIKTGIPADIWRYYLMSIRPEKKTSDFSWKDLQSKVNGELVDNLGNMINRVLQFTDKKLNGIVYKFNANILTSEDTQFIESIGNYADIYNNCLKNIKLKRGLHTILDISHATNKYFQLVKPWELLKTDDAKCKNILSIFVHVVGLVNNMLYPYMPDIAQKIFGILNNNHIYFDLKLCVMSDHKINTPSILFHKITDLQIDEFITIYG